MLEEYARADRAEEQHLAEIKKMSEKDEEELAVLPHAHLAADV
jgi:hypothetical protein